MRVEPGSAPVWEGGDTNPHRRNLLSRMLNKRLMGKNYLGDRLINMPEMVEEEISEDIRKEVEVKIIQKFLVDRRYTDRDKQRVQMTIVAQAGVQAGIIFKEACKRVGEDANLQSELEGMDDKKVAQIFFDEVLKEALTIVDNEFEIQPDLDIEALARREAEVKQKIEKGEMTQEEAKEILKEPIIEKDRETEEEKAYEEKAYEKERKEQKERQQRRRQRKDKNSDRTINADKDKETDTGKVEKADKARKFRRKQADYEKTPMEQGQKENEFTRESEQRNVDDQIEI